jgi:hypothetical protein
MPVQFPRGARGALLVAVLLLASCKSPESVASPIADPTPAPTLTRQPQPAVVGTPTESPEFREAFEMQTSCVQGWYAVTRNARMRANGLELFLYANTLNTFSKAANQVAEVLCQDPPPSRDEVNQLVLTLSQDEGIGIQSFTFNGS